MIRTVSSLRSVKATKNVFPATSPIVWRRSSPYSRQAIYTLQAALVRKYKCGMSEIEAPFLERETAFRFIPFEYHMGGIAV